MKNLNCLLLILITLAFSQTTCCSSDKTESEKQVQIAFELRMNGKVDEAIRQNPSNNILILNLARYHMMMAMQNKDLATKEFPLANTYLEKYLKSIPEPIIPLKAYSKGLQLKIDMFLGNQTEAEKLNTEAKSLDPYFSKASGIPELLLFDPPGKISHNYFSFFSLF